MSGRSRPGRGLAFWTAAGGAGLLALTVLNVAADRFPHLLGLGQYRDYLVRRRG